MTQSNRVPRRAVSQFVGLSQTYVVAESQPINMLIPSDEQAVNFDSKSDENIISFQKLSVGKENGNKLSEGIFNKQFFCPDFEENIDKNDLDQDESQNFLSLELDADQEEGGTGNDNHDDNILNTNPENSPKINTDDKQGLYQSHNKKTWKRELTSFDRICEFDQIKIFPFFPITDIGA